MNRIHAPSLLAALLATSIPVLPSSASAAEAENCSRGPAVTQDVEGRGHLTATAHRASSAQRFEVMDANRDGKVTAAEIGGSRGAESIAWASKMTSPAEKLSQLDTNKDGVLTPKEYADSSQRMFDRLDLDGDGVLSDAEMLTPTKSR